ncbi:META domain-containing protein [Cellulomonas sp. McL0617]|uniref:META domain-containing protein n=1 Tax=Cellulomonas sp. McL0617 TaxID=3415675 RepID=UPI003CEDFE86
MSRRVASLAALLLLGLISGCGAATSSSGDATPATDATGTWGASTTEGSAYLVLGSDGSASGSDGCNRVVGTWKASDTGVSFSAWATTKMYCPEVDPWLPTSVAGLVHDDDTMVLVNQDNLPVGSLQRTS